MKINNFISRMLGISICIIAVACFSFSQEKQKGTGGWGPTEPFHKLFNSAALDTIEGKVIVVDEVFPLKGMTNGLHLIIKNKQGEFSIFTAPLWFIEKLSVIILPKDEVAIIGSRALCEGNPVIIASDITRGKEHFMFRDDKGSPLWAAWLRFMTKPLQ